MKKYLLLLSALTLLVTAKAQYYITTVAGGGTGGDGSPATNALLSLARAVCTDPAGNIYVTSGSTIRKVEKVSGIITTFAGGGTSTADNIPATDAQLGASLKGMCTDNANNLYFTNGYKVYKIDLATGLMVSVAGGGPGTTTGDGGPATAAGINPHGIWFHGPSTLLITSELYNSVRKIDLVTGIINHVAGNGTNSNTGDGGAAAVAGLYIPTSVATDAAGNIYVSCSGAIRKIDLSGTITKLTDGYGPLAVDNAGYLYYGYMEVWKYNLATGTEEKIAGGGTDAISDGPATDARLSHGPQGIKVNAAGSEIYVSASGRVRKIYLPGAGVNNGRRATSLSVKPNPTSGVFILETGISEPHSITVTNISGHVVFSREGNRSSGMIDLRNAGKGVYLLSVQYGNERWHETIVLQ